MATTTKKVSVTGTTTSAAPLLSKDVLGKAVPSIAWTESSKAGSNVFNVDAGTKTATLALKGTSGDVVKINGYSGDYTATLSGLKLTLNSATQTVTVNLAKASKVTLGFTDGDKVVDAAAKLLGTQALSTAALAINGTNSHEIGQLTGTTFTTVADLLAAYNAFAHPTFSIAAAASATEGTNATFTVSLSAPQSTAAKVNLVVTPTGDATAADFDFSHITIPTGFTLANNVLTFPVGVTTGTISIPVVADSVSPETGEGLSIALTAITGSVATVNAAKASGTVTVIDVPPSIIAISPTNATATATAASDTFNVAAGNYTASIAGFGTGDSLVFAPSTVTSVTNTSGADGNLTVTGSLNNQVVTINLTGISAALDAQIIDTASFVSVFAPVGPATTNSISPTATTATATTGPDTFNIAAGNYTASIAGFGAKDKLVFAAGSVEAITNTSGTDGNITVTGSLNNQLVTIQLTGVSATLDSHVFDAASFNTAFGTGSLV